MCIQFTIAMLATVIFDHFFWNSQGMYECIVKMSWLKFDKIWKRGHKFVIFIILVLLSLCKSLCKQKARFVLTNLHLHQHYHTGLCWVFIFYDEILFLWWFFNIYFFQFHQKVLLQVFHSPIFPISRIFWPCDFCLYSPIFWYFLLNLYKSFQYINLKVFFCHNCLTGFIRYGKS